MGSIVSVMTGPPRQARRLGVSGQTSYTVTRTDPPVLADERDDLHLGVGWALTAEQCRGVWRWVRGSRTVGVAACRQCVGAGFCAGEEAEAGPLGELGEHVVGPDAELVGEFAAAPGSAGVV